MSTSWDNYFSKALTVSLGRGLFETIDESDITPPPPVGSAYRITPDGVNRVTPDGAFRRTPA